MRKLSCVLGWTGLALTAALSGCDRSSAQGGEFLTRLVGSTDGNVIRRLVNADGMAFFTMTDPETGKEPWVSDGTPEGTHILIDMLPGPGDGIGPFMNFEPVFVPFQGKVYFPADDGIHGLELWRTDGTVVGTELVVDINPGPVGVDSIQGIRASENRLYFRTFIAGVGAELWVLEVIP